jgi:hypothetical protein
MGLFNGKRAVPILVSRQPGANIVATVDAQGATAGPASRCRRYPPVDRVRPHRHDPRLAARWNHPADRSCWWCWWSGCSCAVGAPR